MFKSYRRLRDALHARWAAAWLPVVGAIVAMGLWLTLPHPLVKQLTAEGGPIERPTEWLYLLVAAIIAGTRNVAQRRTRIALAVTMVAFAAREMDLHRHFTGVSVLKVSFYLGPAPFYQKLWAGVAVILVGATMIFLVRQHAASVWRGFRRREAVSTTIMIFLATMVIAKLLDRSINLLRADFGMTFAPSTVVLVGAFEEIVELTLPLIAVVGIWQRRRQLQGAATPYS